MRLHLPTLVAVLCSSMIAIGCGGGKSPTAPMDPTTVTLFITFNNIEVEDDCDGIEGDGEFKFRLETTANPVDPPEVVYDKYLVLGPGGQSGMIGSRSYTFPVDADAERTVRFRASEVDRDIFGATYNDSRLNNASNFFTYLYTNGTWNTFGSESLTLGVAGCLVRARWTATVLTP